MGVNFGNDKIKDVYFGNDKIREIFIDNEVVYQPPITVNINNSIYFNVNNQGVFCYDFEEDKINWRIYVPDSVFRAEIAVDNARRGVSAYNLNQQIGYELSNKNITIDRSLESRTSRGLGGYTNNRFFTHARTTSTGRTNIRDSVTGDSILNNHDFIQGNSTTGVNIFDTNNVVTGHRFSWQPGRTRRANNNLGIVWTNDLETNASHGSSSGNSRRIWVQANRGVTSFFRYINYTGTTRYTSTQDRENETRYTRMAVANDNRLVYVRERSRNILRKLQRDTFSERWTIDVGSPINFLTELRGGRIFVALEHSANNKHYCIVNSNGTMYKSPTEIITLGDEIIRQPIHVNGKWQTFPSRMS